MKVHYQAPDLFSKPDLGLTKKNMGNFSLLLSSPERSIMETFYLVPDQQSFEEAGLLMEGLRTLRPELVQKLLEGCRSVKVKRLFMLLAEKGNHPWLKRLQLDKVDFGKGKRGLVKGGVLHKKYQITIPKNYYPEEEGFAS